MKCDTPMTFEEAKARLGIVDRTPLPMTNEEWLCNLSTEEKAKFLRQIYRDGRDDYVGEWYEQTEADFVQWLKEIHE